MLTRLAAIQTREGLSDGQMAERLGCSRSLWNQVRRGRMPLSHELAVRAAGAFPELSRDLLLFAADAVTPLTDSAAKVVA